MKSTKREIMTSNISNAIGKNVTYRKNVFSISSINNILTDIMFRFV